MRIKDEKLLNEFRGPGLCELCDRWCNDREPHHVYRRGCGGGTRLDVRINLVAVGKFPACRCHLLVHEGKITQEHVLRIVAEREGMTPDEVQQEIWDLVRKPKETFI